MIEITNGYKLVSLIRSEMTNHREGAVSLAEHYSHAASVESHCYIESAVTVKVRDCQRMGVFAHRVQRWLLKGSVAVAQKDAHKSIGVGGHREVQFAIAVKVSYRHRKRGQGTCKVHGWLEAAVTLAEEYKNAAVSVAYDCQIKIAIPVEIPSRHGGKLRPGLVRAGQQKRALPITLQEGSDTRTRTRPIGTAVGYNEIQTPITVEVLHHQGDWAVTSSWISHSRQETRRAIEQDTDGTVVAI
jgi:hypothetical protein